MSNICFNFTTYELQDDEEIEVENNYPGRFEVCGACQGKGKVDHPAFSNGITESERFEMGEDAMDDYLAGAYDVLCSNCKGQRVEIVVDFKSLSNEQKKIYNTWRKTQNELACELASEQRWQY